MTIDQFLKGVNVHAPEARDHADELIEFLLGTQIEWVRIHPIPSRRLGARNKDGISYLGAIEKFARAGYNLILPIDVGVKDNVGVVTGTGLEKFVDESYSESYKAVKEIETIIAKSRVIYGVENEIDTKEWILQSMPTVRWRESTLSWISLSMDSGLKYKRLGNIFDGIKDASPGSTTMVNFESDDPKDDRSVTMSFLIAFQGILARLGLLEARASMRMNNYRIDVIAALEHLDVDIIGVDNYPNYFAKFPPRGEEIGSKVDEIESLSIGKPVINTEFGYGAGEPSTISLTKDALRRQTQSLVTPPLEAQKTFFENALASIGRSKSRGAFPWVLYLDPSRAYRPDTENRFTLLHRGFGKRLEPAPALQHYLDWLEPGGKQVDASQAPHVKTK